MNTIKKEALDKILEEYSKVVDHLISIGNDILKIQHKRSDCYGCHPEIQEGFAYFTCWDTQYDENIYLRFPIEYLWSDYIEVETERQKVKDEESRLAQEMMNQRKEDEDRKTYERLCKKFSLANEPT